MFTGLIVIALALLPTLISGVIAWFVAKLASSNKNKRYVIAIALTLVANLALYSDQIYYTYQVKSLCNKYGIASIDPKLYENKTLYIKSDFSFLPLDGAEHIAESTQTAYDANSQEPIFNYKHFNLKAYPTILGKVLSPLGVDNRIHMKLSRCELGREFFISSSAKLVAQPFQLKK